jgi:hypothetical protein
MGTGWEVRSEENRTVRRQVQYDDWHRVERVLERFRQEISELTADGWIVQSTNR